MVIARTSACLAVILIVCGCSTPALDQARRHYYAGTPQAGIDILNEASIPDRDRILFLMERGSLYQSLELYEESARDFDEANALLAKMDTLSVSRGATSMVINDNMLQFYGYPFERTYLHVMASLNYLARGDWQGAGVEGRRIINSLTPEVRGDFPEDAFSRYLAGLCMELVDDPSNARVEYRKASTISDVVDVSDMGFFVPDGVVDHEDAATQPTGPAAGQAHVVCMIFVGRIADYSAGARRGAPGKPCVSLMHNGEVLGEAYVLADLGLLAAASEREEAAKSAAKGTARVAGKWAVSRQVAEQNEIAGSLLWLTLLMLEQPDFRHWETLPRYVYVARVPCAADLDSLDVVVRGAGAGPRREASITRPVQQQGLLLVTFDRGW